MNKFPTISEIQLANLVPGAAPVAPSDKGVNEMYVGLIQTSSAQHRAYIKVIEGRQLVNELICSILGRSVGLLIPEGFLVRAGPGDLPESALLARHGGEALLFACVDVGMPSLKRRLAESGVEILANLYATWTQWDSAAIFDEWIANSDRHPGNLLIEGAGSVWLIDHSHALTGPDWNAADLDPGCLVRNQIADQRFPTLTLPERMAVRAKSGELSKVFGLVSTESALQACHATQLLATSDLQAVQRFVSERVNKLFDLISRRLGIPNMGV